MVVLNHCRLDDIDDGHRRKSPSCQARAFFFALWVRVQIGACCAISRILYVAGWGLPIQSVMQRAACEG